MRLSCDLKSGAVVNVISVVAGVRAVAPARGKYSPLSEYEDYDWAIVPFEEYM